MDRTAKGYTVDHILVGNLNENYLMQKLITSTNLHTIQTWYVNAQRLYRKKNMKTVKVN